MKQLFTVTFATILLSYLLTMSSLVSAEQSQQQITEQQQEVYHNHLKYEYRNRGRTYIGMSKAAKHSAGTDRGAFFQAYYELEIINQKILGHMKNELGANYHANWFTRSVLHVTGDILWRFVSPQQLIDVIIPYLPKLKEMQSLGRYEHKPFFAYIVAQEQAQLEASQAAKKESWDSGANVFKDFLPQAEAELARITGL